MGNIIPNNQNGKVQININFNLKYMQVVLTYNKLKDIIKFLNFG